MARNMYTIHSVTMYSTSLFEQNIMSVFFYWYHLCNCTLLFIAWPSLHENTVFIVHCGVFACCQATAWDVQSFTHLFLLYDIKPQCLYCSLDFWLTVFDFSVPASSHIKQQSVKCSWTWWQHVCTCLVIRLWLHSFTCMLYSVVRVHC